MSASYKKLWELMIDRAHGIMAMKKKMVDFDRLVGRIQATSDALQQDAPVVINRSVTARAWLTGYYIVEYERHGADRAKYGEGLLKKLVKRLNGELRGTDCDGRYSWDNGAPGKWRKLEDLVMGLVFRFNDLCAEEERRLAKGKVGQD